MPGCNSFAGRNRLAGAGLICRTGDVTGSNSSAGHTGEEMKKPKITLSVEDYLPDNLLSCLAVNPFLNRVTEHHQFIPYNR